MTFVGYWSPSLSMARIVEHAQNATTRSSTRAAGRVVVVGHCLANGDRFEAAAEAMLRTGQVGDADDWPGCYSMMLITRAGVTLVTDPVGQFPLFVAESQTEIWFGTRAADLARHLGAPPDPLSLTVTLACPESRDLNRSRSMFRGIRQLAEGRAMTIDLSGIRERDHHAFRTDPQATLANSAERLQSALCDAVNARVALADRLTSDLSGGLDSTSLAFLAEQRVAELPVLTSYNPAAPVADDLRRIRRYLQLAPGLRQHVVPVPPERLPYQVIGPLADVPNSASVAMGALRSRLAAARTLGSDLHLVGEGGDVVIGAPLAYFADLARHGDLARLWRDCLAWARLRGRAPLALFRKALLLGVTTRRRALRALAVSLDRGRDREEPTWEAQVIGYWPPPHIHWLTSSARRRLAAHVRDTADQIPDDGLGVGDVVTLGHLRQQTLTQQVVRDAGATSGVAVHAPFLDTQVVRACLALPTCRRADPTVAKPLLRAALSNVVPSVVLSRHTKGDYTRDAYLGVRRAAPVLRQLLAESVAADHGLIEPGPVRAALEGAISGLPTPWGPLNQVLAVEVWLREHEQGRPA